MKTSFGKYTLIERIGTGGMAEVFLAKSQGAEGLEKLLVIKRILPELAENNRFVEMFIGEARIAVALNHPNIITIHDVGLDGGQGYISMELVDGESYARMLQRRGRLDLAPVGAAWVVEAPRIAGTRGRTIRNERRRDARVTPRSVAVGRNRTTCGCLQTTPHGW